MPPVDDGLTLFYTDDSTCKSDVVGTMPRVVSGCLNHIPVETPLET